MPHLSRLALLIAWFLILTACSVENPATRVSVWIHSGQEGERQLLQDQVARFNRDQKDIHVGLTVIPEGTYNGQVQAAALANDLPCLLEFDGPYVYNYVWQGKLLPLDDLLPAAVKADLLTSIISQGTYRGRLYTVATFDSGLGLYSRKSLLQQHGIRIPRDWHDAWTATEFSDILQNLARHNSDGQVLDLKLNYSGEWFSYGFAPVLQSAGADLIDRKDYLGSDGTLNSPAAIRAMGILQQWITDGYVDPNLDDAAFVQQRVAISWVGHWEYRRYYEAFGDDLVILPLPDFGNGTRSGQGSWNWGITTSCARPALAVKFLEFLLQPEEVRAITSINGAVPATRRAIDVSPQFAKGGPLHLYVQQLAEGVTVPRPLTPAYPIISSVFAQAFQDIRNGADVAAALQRAVRVIDQDIADNKGYPHDARYQNAL